MKNFDYGPCFYFLVDFRRHRFENNGVKTYIDFRNLTLNERIILSGYLTSLYNDQNNLNQNMYDLIFNFGNYRTSKSTYQSNFISDLSDLLKKSPNIFEYIKQNYNARTETMSFEIFRQFISSEVMKFVYDMNLTKSYRFYLNVLYIIGVAQRYNISKLNTISMNNFYPTSTSLSKKMVASIFDKLREKFPNLNYEINDGQLFFSNKKTEK